MRLTAGKSRSKGREGWCILFHHPLNTDDEGNPRRMRRGLSTRDEAEADRLVAQMNRILYDETLWHLAAKERAAREFDPRVVSIFYDVLEPAVTDGWSLREEGLPLPGREDGFAKVLILGSTGAGKTTLVRQLIGSHPRRDRFPSTSTAKTTVADIEVVLDGGDHSAVVSFFMKDKVRLNIEECVTAAVGAAAEGAVPVKVAGHLLEHPEQRFRLSYLLGAPNFGGGDDWDDWDDAEPGDVDSEDPEVGDAISGDERAALEATVLGYVEKCVALAAKHRDRLEDAFGLAWNDLGPGDRDAFQELLEEHILADAEAQELIDEIMDEVESKFALLDRGELERHHGWPIRWTFTTEDRGEFIGAVNRFTSNYADHFGRLLTPLVEGIRVRGPFRPAWFDDDDPLPKLVLLDGEGLGHTSETSASLPTSVTSKYALADTILLVDNAKQPMLAAPSAVIRSVAATGHDSKLGIVFTHFDQVKGDNLRGVAAKRTHVQNSLDNALLGLEGILGSTTMRGVRRNLQDRTYFTANTHLHMFGDNKAMRKFTTAELQKILERAQASVKPVPPPDATPIYDTANLVLCVSDATKRFRRSWDGRLGLAPRPGVSKEHWTRVKALARRLAKLNEDHYDTLMPVADLTRELTEGLVGFIANPREWDPANADEETRQAAVESVRREASSRLAELVNERLWTRPFRTWLTAHARSGKGSGRTRSKDIWSIFDSAAPELSGVPSSGTAEFLDELRAVFKQAVEEAGGRVVG